MSLYLKVLIGGNNYNNRLITYYYNIAKRKKPETAIPDHNSGVASGIDNIKSNYTDGVNIFDSI